MTRLITIIVCIGALLVSCNELEQDDERLDAFKKSVSPNVITAFSLTNKKNGNKVLKDLESIIDGNTITLSSPYITTITDLVPTFTSNGKVYVGAEAQISGTSSMSFASPVTYRVVADDGEENLYTVKVKYSGLPVMEINTPNAIAITSKEDWVKNVAYRIITTDGKTDCEGTLSIKGRGNSTWSCPKKPYAIKLDSKTKVLGLPKEKRFDLLANWMDRTLLRNDVTFHLAYQTNSMGWNPSGKFVEVVFNGTHIGNYYLCEHIKVGKGRMDITEINENATSGNAQTGGYLMEIDVNYDEKYKFKSTRRELPYMFKDPDEVNNAQFNYMKQYIDNLEASLYDDVKFSNREFVNYMDIDSYVDWWLVYELAGNGEPNWPKSCYAHKDKNGKLVAGPVWDFDCGTYKYDSWCAKDCMYYGRLFQDATFIKTVKDRWNSLKATFKAVAKYIEQQGEYLAHSDELNIALWPISSRENGDETLSYTEAIARMKENYEGRILWMDAQINAW